MRHRHALRDHGHPAHPGRSSPRSRTGSNAARPTTDRRLRRRRAASPLGARLAPARAGDKDADGLVAVAEGLNDLVGGKGKDAQKKLEDALKACKGAACEPGTRAQLWVALGIVAGSGLKDHKKALAAFEAALREDPKVVPDKQFMTPGLNKLFAEAQKNAKKPPRRRHRRAPPPGKEQLAGVSAAAAQLAQKDWSSCMGTLIALMGDKEFAAGKLQLAQCEDAGGLLLEAAADARLALKDADEEGNAELKKKANDLLAKLINDTPTIVVVMPKTVDDAQLFVDGVAVAKEAADKPIPHNPGKATIEVKGKKGTFPFAFKSIESFDRGERVTVNVEQAGGGANNSAIQQCLQSARNAADLNRCIESGGKGRGLTLRGGLEVASYNDTFHVDVLAPTLFFSAENPTAGWSLGATYGVDVVSNASPDIVATASPRYDEIRNDGSLTADLKIGPARVGIDGALSIEPDYVGRGVGASVSADFRNKQITPTLSYHVGFDILGRATTPFSVFSRNILTHGIDVSILVRPRARPRWPPSPAPSRTSTATPPSPTATSRCSRPTSPAADPPRRHARAGERRAPRARALRAGPHRARPLRRARPHRAPLRERHHPRRRAPLRRHLGPQGHHHRRPLPPRRHQDPAPRPPRPLPRAERRPVLEEGLRRHREQPGLDDPPVSHPRPRAEPALRRHRRRQPALAAHRDLRHPPRGRGDLHPVPRRHLRLRSLGLLLGHHPGAGDRMSHPSCWGRPPNPRPGRSRWGRPPNPRPGRTCFLVAAALLACGCRNDPVPQAIIDGLPPDSSPNGPLHRAGQPCLACHDKYGGATEFAVGGTVYALDSTGKKLVGVPAPNVRVNVLDSSPNGGASLHACSNAAGNFFILASNWTDITFPLTPSAGGLTMQSLIGRDGSCATCHKLPDAQSLDPVAGAGHDSAGVILVDPSKTDPTCAGSQ